MCRYLYVDTETSGTAEGSEIIQLSYIYALGTKIYDYGDIYYKTLKPFDSGSIAVHGLSKRKVDSLARGTFQERCRDLIPIFSRCTHIVNHNISFDLNRIMEYNNVDLNKAIEDKLLICTMRDFPKLSLKTISSENVGQCFAWSSLTELCTKFINQNLLDIDATRHEYLLLTGKKAQAHDAMFDVFLTYKCHNILMALSTNANTL